jgi:hypothetical protein
MRKILLIDKGDSSVQKFRKSLTDKGSLIINEQSIDRAMPYIKNEDLDLIIIDSLLLSDDGSSGEFRHLTVDIPKIILSAKNSPKSNKLWRRDTLAIQVDEPVSLKDFKYWSERLLKDKLIKDKNIALQAEVKNMKKELKFHDDTSKGLAENFELKTLLNSIMEKTKTMAEAEVWSVILDDDPFFDIIPLRISKKVQKLSFEKGVGIAGWVLEKSIPVTVQNVLKDALFNKKIDDFPGLKVGSLMCVPLKIKDRVVGVLRLINKNRLQSGKKPQADAEDEFTEADLTMLISAANYIGIAIERTFLYQKTKNDDLTNLYNAHYLNQALDVEIERSRRYRSMFSIVFMDLDNFKKVNDKYGHLIGAMEVMNL